MVGSCVRFTDGQPDKNMFRRFHIKTVIGQDDYASLQEIVSRRYEKTRDFPDLILIDGGKGQLNAARKVFPDAEIASLAKREETVFSHNNNGYYDKSCVSNGKKEKSAVIRARILMKIV